ncbi:MAG: glycosyltransferase [Armatimonadetes bacterium]|nr:glycosyltransferase [Armatimonadota bacterium]
MNNLPLVSVLTPCYNSGDYLESCLQSVSAQDYPHVEHVVQDGGSNDDTLDILRRYAGRVDWISEPDKGQSDALNKALQRCRGDIIAVLNADDEFLPHAASWAATQLAAYPDAAMIYGDQYNISPEGQVISECPGPDPYDFHKVLCVEQVPPAQAAFIRRECYEAVGWYVDVTRKTCPDYEMWVRLGRKFPMKHVPGFVARYRIHPESQGCQAPWVEEMVKSKREVMDRVFDDPQAPADLRRLRRRAYGGLLWWSADVYLIQGDVRRGLARAAQALAVYPSLKQWRRLPGYLWVSQYVARHRRSLWALSLEAARKRKAAEC